MTRLTPNMKGKERVRENGRDVKRERERERERESRIARPSEYFKHAKQCHDLHTMTGVAINSGTNIPSHSKIP